MLIISSIVLNLEINIFKKKIGNFLKESLKCFEVLCVKAVNGCLCLSRMERREHVVSIIRAPFQVIEWN